MIDQRMTVTVNGKERNLPAATALVRLLEDLGVDRRLIAVAHNGEVIPRNGYEDIILQHGDRLEVVRMVGGG